MAGGGSNKGERRGGRQKGVPNKRTEEKAAALAASGLLPRDYLLSVMRDEGNDTQVRVDAAKAAAPYCHSKMPQAVTHTGSVEMSHKMSRDAAVAAFLRSDG